MAPRPKSSTAHDASNSPSYPMGPFSTGGSSYTNTVPEEADEAQNTQHDRDADLSDPNTYPPPNEAPPVYAPPNRHPPGHAPPPGGYGSQQHLLDSAPAHPPPAYSKYTTAAQARWARSSRIAKFLCVSLLVAMIIIIVAVAAGVTLTRGGGSPNDGNNGNFGNGNGPGGGFPGNCSSDLGARCTSSNDCQSQICRADGTCGC